ncbi:hypothetical protein TKK_0014964 [Trichogramma kaykai]|uniref:Gamma-interferon-inducible lysosomal thiol reductase n=1 Tax=Trichogramma kaykai TaxID=54128 RepID=A0ABD2WDC0_9HYME
MSRFSVFAGLLTIASLALFASAHHDVTLDVYYESQCPDSVAFITQQLGPNYNEFKDHIIVNLTPFGKASWITADSGKTEFTCQHGPTECRGNKAQSCLMAEIDEHVSVAAERQAKKIEIVACAMADKSASSPADAVFKCAASKGLNDEAVKHIEACTDSERGDKLLIANGEKTIAFEKPLSFVPSIVVNGSKNQDAFRQLRSVLCGLIPDGEKHGDACK